MIFHTASGSAYEIDVVNKQARRLNGLKDPTPRTGKDGEWRKFNWVSDIVKGIPVFIQWTNAVPVVTGDIPGTLTSVVVEICEDIN